MKRGLIFWILIMFFVSSFSTLALAWEPGDTLWTNHYGGDQEDQARAVQQTYDGGYILTGFTESYSYGLEDVWLVKMDEDGNEVWAKHMGGYDFDEGNDVKQTSDGYIVVGYTQSFTSENADVYVVKTDAAGSVSWWRTFGGDDDDVAKSVCVADNGDFVIAGYTKSFGAGLSDFWVIRLNTYGDTIWTKTFGGAATDQAFSIKETSDNGFIVAGFTESFGNGSADIWLIKINGNGDAEWSSFAGTEETEVGYSVVQAPDGGYAVAGKQIPLGSSFANCYLAKFNGDGELLWTRNYGSDLNDEARSLVLSDEGYTFAGFTDNETEGYSDFYLMGVDWNGDSLWARNYGGSNPDLAYSLDRTSDGAYILAGYSQSFTNGLSDFYVVKTAPNFPPVIEFVSQNPLIPRSIDSVEVVADIYDPDGSIDRAYLFYGNFGLIEATAIDSIEMLPTGSPDEYFGFVPPEPAGDTIDYFIKAWDNANQLTVSADTLSYIVNIPPVIEDVARDPEHPGEYTDCEVSATITDPESVVDHANLYYIIETDTTEVLMSSNDDHYYAIIPGQPSGTIITYYISAWDDLNDVSSSQAESFAVNYSPDIDGPYYTPLVPRIQQPVSVWAIIGDQDAGLSVDHVNLYYDNGSGEVEVLMDNAADSFYAEIPGQDEGVSVSFYVVAWDNYGEQSVSETESYTTNYAPVIESIALDPPSPDENDSVNVVATITDQDQFVMNAYLHYQIGEDDWHTEEMSNQEDDEWTAVIPGQDATTLVKYAVSAVDTIGDWDYSDTLYYYVGNINLLCITNCLTPEVWVNGGIIMWEMKVINTGEYALGPVIGRLTPIIGNCDEGTWVESGAVDKTLADNLAPNDTFLAYYGLQVNGIPEGIDTASCHFDIGLDLDYPLTNSCFSFVFVYPWERGQGKAYWPQSDWIEIDNPNIELPGSFALSNNYPNPFNAQTNISFDLPKASKVNLTIYNLLGQKVKTLVDKSLPAGQHTVIWDAGNYASGVYFYKLQAGDFVTTKKMNLLK